MVLSQLEVFEEEYVEIKVKEGLSGQMNYLILR